jgi:hydroxypyruvate isomerase
MALRYTANLTFLFGEVPFEKRIRAAATAGFTHVECMFPYAWSAQFLRDELDATGLRMELFNMYPGDFTAGDRGLLVDPQRRDEFRSGLMHSLEYAQTLACPRLHAMVGNVPEGVAWDPARACLVENLRYAAPLAAQAGVTLTIEALNAIDFPFFFLRRSAEAFAVLKEVDQPNVKFQFDFYHLQISEGNLTQTFRAHLGEIGHVQIADVPGRHQPGTGEINYPFVLRSIEESGYAGFVGLEYIPQGHTDEALAWLPREARALSAGASQAPAPEPRGD